ncbi:MAG: hypothetical protein NXI24_02460 [bacterium]|nr:hypothetical protein [bacterium]
MNLRASSITGPRFFAAPLLLAATLVALSTGGALFPQSIVEADSQNETGLFDSDAAAETAENELLFDPNATAELPPGMNNDVSSADMAGESESFVLTQADGQAGQLGSAPLNGFADAPWGSTFTEVRTRLKNLATSATAIERVEILNEERNRFILVKRNDVMYRYSFYKTPYNVALLQNHNLSTEEHDEVESRLYHVKVSTPFILSQYVKDKLAVIYGLNARSTVNKEMKGADIWEPDGGLIFQWYEPYRGKAFTRTVDYLSLDLAKEIMTEYADYFDAREKLILQKILLQ